MIPSLTVCVGDIFPQVQERRVGQRGITSDLSKRGRERERNGKRRWRERRGGRRAGGRGDKTVGGRDAKSLLDIRATLKNYPEISGDEKGREGKPREGEESIKVRLDLLVFAAAPLALPSHCHAAGT